MTSSSFRHSSSLACSPCPTLARLCVCTAGLPRRAVARRYWEQLPCFSLLFLFCKSVLLFPERRRSRPKGCKISATGSAVCILPLAAGTAGLVIDDATQAIKLKVAAGEQHLL